MTTFICHNKHKICGIAICALITIGGVGTVHAANCPANFYLNSENECKYCGGKSYCPGDDVQYQCPDDKWAGKYEQFFDDTFISSGNSVISAWGSFFTYNGEQYRIRSNINDCHRNV
ncbi:MAG: hypothetical protein IJ560_00165, partial [Alphaproteobacteria bacterium]|nr:hypothetical protein [Alphaproteobacteria bacterium]